MTQVTTGNGGGFLGHVQQMLNTHPGDVVFDRTLLLNCIKACFDCAQACVSCADACVAESDPKLLAMCIRLNNDCADLCQTTGKILSRQTFPNRSVVQVIVQATDAICRACAEECRKHGAKMEHCRVCADACAACASACQRVLSAA